ncbi:MAG TPA: penicillin-binding protein activator [bacterium]|nr:penicillin-binding protein activator [bacterium]HPG46888.1 penicillin-binding protein activator [bacterium]HPM99132.1 penicillin-binding protein activator [bacterium]
MLQFDSTKWRKLHSGDHFFVALVALMLAVISLTGPLIAKESNNEDLFNQALILYRNQQFEEAKVKWLLLTAQGQENSQLTASLLMLAKTYDHLHDPILAQSYALVLVNQFPGSRYRADARLLLAQLAEHNNEPLAALDHLLFTLTSTTSEAVSNRAIDLANRILAVGMSPDQIQTLATSHTRPDELEWIRLWRARASYGQGNKNLGDRLTDELLASKPSQRIQKAALQMKSLPAAQLAYPLRLGMVLPLSGIFNAEAADFLRGAAFALHERNKELPKIELIVKDSKGNGVQAAKEMLSLQQESVAAVIGELEGNLSAVIAGVAATSNCPLIVPVATDIGLASLNPAIFQLNGDLETRAAELARHAIESRNLRTFATLAPADDYGYALTDAFCSAVDRLGGRVVVQQWYYHGTEDLQRQFKAIRRAGFYEAFRDSLIRRHSSVTADRLERMFNQLDAQVKRASTDHQGVLESTDIPVRSIDAIFLPIYVEDIPYIAPQMALYNIRAQALGGNFWANQEILNRQQRYINGAIFFTGFYLPEFDPNYISFKNKFRQTTSASPAEMAIYGYNTLKVLIDAIDSGHQRSAELINHLNSLSNFQVLGGEIELAGHQRINRAINLFEFRDGNIQRLSD